MIESDVPQCYMILFNFNTQYLPLFQLHLCLKFLPDQQVLLQSLQFTKCIYIDYYIWRSQQSHIIKTQYKYNPNKYAYMKVSYSLKQSAPADFSISLIRNIEECYDTETAAALRNILSKVCELRTKATTTLTLRADMTDEQIDKNIELLSVYTKYALVILRRFNWNPNRGRAVEGLVLSWKDSFQPTIQFKKNTISFDVFCCFYNLSVMYVTRALKLSTVDLDSARKDGMNKAKAAAYLLKEMKEKYYGEFVNTGFHDTVFAHLDILENVCMGLIYKSLYNNFRSNEYKFGVDRIAAICAITGKYFFKAYSVAQTFFMNPSGIADKTKSELLALTYIESLYFDVINNIKYAKHYKYLSEKDHTLISLVIAYERKAQRLLDIGLKNQSVETLFNQNKAQKTELINMQEELRTSLATNLARNKEIYKQPEVAQKDIPPTADLPQELTVKLVCPANLIMEDEGEFGRLMSEDAYSLATELISFSDSRKQALESSEKKLDEQIEKAYTGCYVNYYLQMQDSTPKNLPRVLQEKLLQIKKKGGRSKIEIEVKGLNDNQINCNKAFMQLKQLLSEEEYKDTQKRNQYGQQWSRPASSVSNKQYTKAIESLEGKFKIAKDVDAKILDKYNKHKKYIDTLNGSEEDILKVLPKPQVSQFLEANKLELSKLKEKADLLKKHRDAVLDIGMQIRDRLQKINYAKLANQYLGQNLEKGQIFKKVFSEVEALIANFNEECKNVKDEVQLVSTIATSLNGKNKDQQVNKREFEEVINSFNEISHLFVETSQGSAFYVKLNDHLAKLNAEVQDFCFARKINAEEIEASINNKRGGNNQPQGFGFGLPQLYPGQAPQQVPSFVPPPIPQSFFNNNNMWPQQNMGFNNQPNNNFGTFPMANFNADPFSGPQFPSQFYHK